MTRFLSITVLLLLAVGGCKSKSDDAPKQENTAEAKQPEQQPDGPNALNAKTDDRQHIKVTNVREFIDAIGDNRVIELTPGQYNLAEAKDRYMDHVRWEKVHDGVQVVFRNVRNLKIVGIGDEPVSVTTPSMYAYVLSFRDTTGIVLANLRLGHEPDAGYCAGGVVSVLKSSDILIDGCDLYGCGTEGITTEGVRKMLIKNSTIRDCTYGIMTLRSTQNVTFMGTKMLHNRCYTPIMIDDCRDIAFVNCRIADNLPGNVATDVEPLFTVTSSSNVTVSGGEIVNNRVSRLVDREGTVQFTNVTTNGNQTADP